MWECALPNAARIDAQVKKRHEPSLVVRVPFKRLVLPGMVFRLRKWIRIISVASLILLALVLLLRNQIAHVAIEQLGSHFLENRIKLERIEIGWSTIRLRRLAVLETRLDDLPQVRIEQIVVEPSLLAGIRTGKYVRAITVESPEFHLRFDAKGRLLTHFPASQSTDAQPLEVPAIPLEMLMVRDASVSVHQEGRDSLVIEGGKLSLQANEVLRTHLIVQDVLGAQFQLKSLLDAQTLEGRTSFALDPLELHPSRISQLPLVPKTICNIPTSSHLSLQARFEHPADFFNFLLHDAVAEIQLTKTVNTIKERQPVDSVKQLVHDFLSEDLGSEVSFRAFKQAGSCSLAASVPISNGKVDLQAGIDLSDDRWPAQARLDVHNLQLGPIARLFQPDLPADAVLSATGKLTGNKEGEDFSFQSSVKAVFDEIRYDQIVASPVITKVASRGSLNTSTGQPSGTIVADIESAGIDLAVIQSFVPQYALSGQVGFTAGVSVPMESLFSPSAIDAHCQVSSSGITIDEFESNSLSVTASVSNGNITIDASPVTIGPTAPNSRSAGIANKLGLSPTGKVTLAGNAGCALDSAADVASWHALATAEYRGVSVQDVPLTDGQAVLRLDCGVARLEPVSIQWQDLDCRVSAEADVQSPIRGRCKFAASNIELAEVGAVASRIAGQTLDLSGMAVAEGIATFDLQKNTFQANGFLTVQDCVARGFRIGDSRLAWSANPRSVQIQSSSDKFFGGNYAVAATIRELDWTTTTLAARCNDIQIGRLIAPLQLPVEINGRLSGQFSATRIADLSSLKVVGHALLDRGTIGRLPYRAEVPSFLVRDGKATLAAESKLAGGDIAIGSSCRLTEVLAWQSAGGTIEDLPVTLQIDTTPLAINQLTSAIAGRNDLRGLRGSVDFHLQRSASQIDNGTLCNATASLQNISFGSSTLVHRVNADVLLTPNAAKLNQLAGKVAGGTLLGDAELSFPAGITRLKSNHSIGGRYRFSLANVNLRRLGAALDVGNDVTGLASISAKGRIGPVVTAGIRTKLSNVLVNGLAVREIRIPVSAEYSPNSRRGAWHVHGASIYTGGGTVTLNSEGNLSAGRASFTAKADVVRVDTAKLFRSGGVNAGIVDGEALLRAKRAKAPEDVVGGFNFRLSQLQGFELPGFDQLMQIVKMPSFTMNQLGEDDLAVVSGRIGGGLIHIDDATLSKSGILVMAEGTSTLGGRLDMDVTAVTNLSGPASGLLELTDSPLMLAAPAQVALIAKANDLLKDRVFYIEVAGTTRKPALHVQPGKNLSQDALRVVLSSALGGNAAEMLVRRPSQIQKR
ncbi:MAG TPA: hypothetical protein DDW52_17130 [Planctomycetaceae bacterium]|nr:hypothetical protein [Planctomycetaceae bacterium]